MDNQMTEPQVAVAQTVPEKANNFEKSFSSKKLFLLERDKELKQLMYALLIGEHLFLQGDAGTGKSMLARHAFSLVENAKLFSIQMSEATLSEHLFGAYDILTWKNKGVLMRDITNSIIEADFAFIDEIFDGREDVLRTLLGVLNERKFMEGRQQEDAKLQTAVATANYQTINEKTIPILDRFLFKAIIKPLKAKANRISMYNQHLSKQGKLTNYKIKPLMTIDQLREFTDKIYSGVVTISPEVLDVYDEMILEYTKEMKSVKKKYISARTTNKLLDIVKAAVLLDNRTDAQYADLFEIKYGLCIINDDEEEKCFDRVYKRCVESLEDEKKELSSITDLENQLKLDAFNTITLQPEEYVARMKALKKALTELKAINASTDKVREQRDTLVNKVEKIYTDSKNKFFQRNDL
jgi:MoxR-like ATPase